MQNMPKGARAGLSDKLLTKLLDLNEDEVKAMIECGRPLYNGLPTRLSLYLLEGLRKPVPPQHISRFKGVKITDPTPAILAARNIMQGVDPVPGRRKWSYVTRESGLAVMRGWAKKSHDFALYLDAYQPPNVDRLLACREVDMVIKVGFSKTSEVECSAPSF